MLSTVSCLLSACLLYAFLGLTAWWWLGGGGLGRNQLMLSAFCCLPVCCLLSAVCPPRTHRLVVGGGHASRAGTSPICVAARAAANESNPSFCKLPFYIFFGVALSFPDCLFLLPSSMIDPLDVFASHVHFPIVSSSKDLPVIIRSHRRCVLLSPAPHFPPRPLRITRTPPSGLPLKGDIA